MCPSQGRHNAGRLAKKAPAFGWLQISRDVPRPGAVQHVVNKREYEKGLCDDRLPACGETLGLLIRIHAARSLVGGAASCPAGPPTRQGRLRRRLGCRAGALDALEPPRMGAGGEGGGSSLIQGETPNVTKNVYTTCERAIEHAHSHREGTLFTHPHPSPRASTTAGNRRGTTRLRHAQ